jgi:hypothetical protein
MVSDAWPADVETFQRAYRGAVPWMTEDGTPSGSASLDATEIRRPECPSLDIRLDP